MGRLKMQNRKMMDQIGMENDGPTSRRGGGWKIQDLENDGPNSSVKAEILLVM